MVLTQLKNWFSNIRKSRRSTRRPIKRSRRLELEPLEARMMPVIGAFSPATISKPGDSFDGVVQVAGANYGGTGTLMADGRHILTAAHVVDSDGTSGTFGADGDVTITYNLARGTTPLIVKQTIPASKIIVNPNWDGNPDDGNDIAIIPLIDSVIPAADRQMVAPFTAQRFNLFTGDALHQDFTMVGYGETGIGNDGEHSDEVQQVNINQSWGMPQSGTFTLTFNGSLPSNAIDVHAAASEVALALKNLSTIGNDAKGNSNVSVYKVKDGVWDVRFGSYTNAKGDGVWTLGYGPQPSMTGNAKGIRADAVVTVTRLWSGNGPGINDVRRVGRNTIDYISS
ncbi:MAG TPA: trypsin-like serine protease, partial [Gemmataceae bacterium]|nr:trypsin-like serine protease [Gemmataceae bacterium]